MKVKRSLSITYEEEWSGVSIMDHPCMCIHCDGEGEIATDDFECPCCSGEGVHEVYFDCGAWTEVDCEKCHGTGRISKRVDCEFCDGTGIMHHWDKLKGQLQKTLDGRFLTMRKCKVCGRTEIEETTLLARYLERVSHRPLKVKSC